MQAIGFDQVGLWLACLVAVLYAASLIKGLLPSARKPPLEAEFATKAEVATLRADLVTTIGAIRTELSDGLRRFEQENDLGHQVIDSRLIEHAKQAEERASKLHLRIDALATDTHTLIGAFREHRKQENP